MTTLLAIETSEAACSAALWLDGEILEQFEIVPRRHSELILSMIDRLLEKSAIGKSQLDAIAFGRGPGSFTGVRIATGVVQGIAFALDKPVVPVSTLLALAQGVYRQYGEKSVVAAFDARMHEVYCCPCQLGNDGLMRAVADEAVLPPEMVSIPDGDEWCGAGSGWLSYEELLRGNRGVDDLRSYGDALCHAQDVAVLAAQEYFAGNTVPAMEAVPVYLRNQVASLPKSFS